MSQESITRRKFLRASAGIVGSIALGSTVAASAPAAPAPAPVPPTAAAAVAAAPTAAPVKPTAAATVSTAPKKLQAIYAANFLAAADNAIKARMEKWGQDNGFQVTAEVVASASLPAKIAAAMSTQQGPDIIVMEDSTPLINAHSLIDVSDVVAAAKTKLGTVYPTVDAYCNSNGVYRAAPYAAIPQGWLYRMDLFAQVGYNAFPKTTDEFLDAATKLKALGKPVGVSVASNNGDAKTFCYSILFSFGGMERDQGGKVAINSPETLAALQWAKQFFAVTDPGGFGWDASGNNRAYDAGVDSCINNAASLYISDKSSNADLAKNTGLSGAPKGPAGGFFNFGTKSLAITKWSPNPDAAKALVGAILTPDGINDYISNSGGLVWGAYSYFKDNVNPVFTADAKLAGLQPVLEQGRWPGYASKPSAQSAMVYDQDVIVNMFSQVNTGTDPAKAIAAAETTLKNLYV